MIYIVLFLLKLWYNFRYIVSMFYNLRLVFMKGVEVLMIVIEDVCKDFLNFPNALNGINLSINSGEFVYLVGPSGAGKSTLIKLLYREEQATRGKLYIDNVDVATYSNRKTPLLRRKIGIVFQENQLLSKLTVYENVAFSLRIVGESPYRFKHLVLDVLELVGLQDKLRMKPTELSGGEQQRVSIARAIVNKPKLVIADEPTGNLDPVTSLGILRLFEEINKLGTTIIMATHNDYLVNNYRHRVIAIKNGEIFKDEMRGSYGYEA